MRPYNLLFFYRSKTQKTTEINFKQYDYLVINTYSYAYTYNFIKIYVSLNLGSRRVIVFRRKDKSEVNRGSSGNNHQNAVLGKTCNEAKMIKPDRVRWKNSLCSTWESEELRGKEDIVQERCPRS